MKKLIAAIIMIFLLSGCGGRNSYNEISLNKFLELTEKKESFVLVIGSSTCSACTEYKPTMEKIIKKYNLDIKYLDLSKLSEEEENKFKSLISFQYTPTTIFFTDGVEESTYNRIVGAKESSYIINKLKSNGYIKEN